MSPKPAPKPSIMATTEDGSPVVEVFSMKLDGERLVMDVKALGSMRMDVVITPEAVAKGWSVVKDSRKDIFGFVRKLRKPIKLFKKQKA